MIMDIVDGWLIGTFNERGRRVTLRERILVLISQERERQVAQHGESIHFQEWWMVLLMEEVGEAALALVKEDDAMFMVELIHIAAVAVAALEQYTDE